jgi:hypothetical protein
VAVLGALHGLIEGTEKPGSNEKHRLELPLGQISVVLRKEATRRAPTGTGWPG